MKIQTLLNDTIHPKNNQIRLEILKIIIEKGAVTHSDISKQISLSIPTISKIVAEMVEFGLLYECGKADNQGSRKASLYDINMNAGYFIGIDIQKNSLLAILTDFSGNLLVEEKYPYFLEDTEEAYSRMVSLINTFLDNLSVSRENIITMGICMKGIVNVHTGNTYGYFASTRQSLTERLEEKFNVKVLIENDARAGAYGEFICGAGKSSENAIYVNISWGLGVGIIANKEIYYGKSGYAGEYGHLPMFDNEILCHCGKKGCLETEASGSAIVRRFKSEYSKGSSTILKDKMNLDGPDLMNEILHAAKEEDLLSLETIDVTGRVLGKYISGLLNIFNPDVLILGGEVGTLGKQISLPIETGIMKHSLNFVNQDTEIRISKLRGRAAAVGVCLLARNKMLGIVRG
ncbi:MAG: ROK family transcriptional regulator [Bacteroidales bacterium]